MISARKNLAYTPSRSIPITRSVHTPQPVSKVNVSASSLDCGLAQKKEKPQRSLFIWARGVTFINKSLLAPGFSASWGQWFMRNFGFGTGEIAILNRHINKHHVSRQFGGAKKISPSYVLVRPEDYSYSAHAHTTQSNQLWQRPFGSISIVGWFKMVNRKISDTHQRTAKCITQLWYELNKIVACEFTYHSNGPPNNNAHSTAPHLSFDKDLEKISLSRQHPPIFGNGLRLRPPTCKFRLGGIAHSLIILPVVQ